jgi:acyl-CoA synthetase (NDP forming)
MLMMTDRSPPEDETRMTREAMRRLLTPRSVAIVGASPRPDTPGRAMVDMARIDGFAGEVHAVNPRHAEIDGLPCHPSLAALPGRPDHVVIGVANARVEAALDEAIAAGASAATIFGSLQIDGDAGLPGRIAARARQAGLALCGANCMGFYSPLVGLRVASFPSPAGLTRGGIAWIAQSGSAFAALAHNDRRLGFTLCASTGMELVTTAADYMDWALSEPETRVIGLFLETVRDPARFVGALERAAEREVPVVVLKVGRTERSARMAVSHTGAMAGDDAVYEAVFRRHGVVRVEDMDEMAATLALFETGRRTAPGRLATIHDSGGEREMVVDLAEDRGLAFAEIGEETVRAIAPLLEPGLVAENPLDLYGTNDRYVERFAAATAAMMADPDVALGLFMSNPRDGYWYAEGYAEAVMTAAASTPKPLALVSNSVMTDERRLALRLRAAGVPLIRGTRNGLAAAGHLMAHRDFASRRPEAPPAIAGSAAERWRVRLAEAGTLAEHEGLRMAEEFGLRVPAARLVTDRGELAGAIDGLARPLCLKTAEGHAHKTDIGGVRLNLSATGEILDAYEDLARRIGPRVLVMEMAPRGIEIGLGALFDPDFGPVVIVSAGGTLIELLDDRRAALAPFGADEAARLVRGLKVSRLLGGVRGAPAADRAALCAQIAAFSVMAASLAGVAREVEINPIIATASGAWAVDCLAVGAERPDLTAPRPS